MLTKFVNKCILLVFLIMNTIDKVNLKKQILCIRTEKKILQLAPALTLKTFLNILDKIDNIV